MGKGFKLPGVSPLKQQSNSSTSLPQFDRSGYRSSAGSYSSPQSIIDTSQGNLFANAIGTIGDVFSTAITPNPPNPPKTCHFPEKPGRHLPWIP